MHLKAYKRPFIKGEINLTCTTKFRKLRSTINSTKLERIQKIKKTDILSLKQNKIKIKIMQKLGKTRIWGQIVEFTGRMWDSSTSSLVRSSLYPTPPSSLRIESYVCFELSLIWLRLSFFHLSIKAFVRSSES